MFYDFIWNTCGEFFFYTEYLGIDDVMFDLWFWF